MRRKIFHIAALAALCFIGWPAVTRDVHPWSLAGAALMAAAAAFFAAPIFFEENPLEIARPPYRLDLLLLVFLTWLAEGYMASAEIPSAASSAAGTAPASCVSARDCARVSAGCCWPT